MKLPKAGPSRTPAAAPVTPASLLATLRRDIERTQAFLPKPHLLLDDAQLSGWKIVELHPNECMSLGADEVLAKLKR